MKAAFGAAADDLAEISMIRSVMRSRTSASRCSAAVAAMSRGVLPPEPENVPLGYSGILNSLRLPRDAGLLRAASFGGGIGEQDETRLSSGLRLLESLNDFEPQLVTRALYCLRTGVSECEQLECWIGEWVVSQLCAVLNTVPDCGLTIEP